MGGPLLIQPSTHNGGGGGKQCSKSSILNIDFILYICVLQQLTKLKQIHMKKLIFTSLMVGAVGVFSASAQALIDNSAEKTFKSSNDVVMPSEKSATKLSKAGQIADWYSPLNWAISAGAELFLKPYVRIIMPDSLPKYILDGDTIIRGNAYGLGFGQIIDPKDDNIDQTTNPGLKLTRYTGYSVDSIALAYLYVRNVATKSDGNGGTVPVKDTLIFSYFSVPKNGIIKSTLTNNGGVVAYVPWNKASLSPTGFIGQQKVVIDELDSTSASNANGGFENSWRTAVKVIAVNIPGGFKVPANGAVDNLVGFTVKFKPGHNYDSNSVIVYQRDPVAFPLNKPRVNYFGYRYLNNEGTPEQQIKQTKFYTNSLISTVSAGYQTSNSNGWAGYVPGNAYFNNSYLQADFFVNTLNAGLKDIKNDNFAMTSVYPNPANENGTAVMGFNLKSSSTVAVNIYNIAGQQVKSVINKTYAAGEHAVEFDLAGLKAGIYMVNMTVNGVSQTKKLTITE